MTDSILQIGESGLETTDQKVKSMVNRMVNSQTPGFKGSDITVRSFPLELQNAEDRIQSEKPQVDGTFYDKSRGALERTGKSTDLALGADGFFVIMGPWGEGYTRDGRLTVDPEGKLVTSSGKYPLMGQNGPISIPSGSDFEVNPDGQVTVNGTSIDRIRVVNFDSFKELKSLNGSIFSNPSGRISNTEVPSPKIVQGYVESSNVNVVDEYMNLVLLNQVFNMDTKIVSNREANLTQALTMGKTQ